jgi:hypothetical protein
MNYRLSTILLAVALLLVLGVSVTQAAPGVQPAASVPQVAPDGYYDFAVHGGWSGRSSDFAEFYPKSYGTFVRAKVGGGTFWVHNSIPITTRVADTGLRLQYVEFCMKSSDPTNAKLTAWQLWEYPNKKFSIPFTWDPNNYSFQCFGYTFSNPVFRQDLGFSISLQFANQWGEIILGKAWARFIP